MSCADGEHYQDLTNFPEVMEESAEDNGGCVTHTSCGTTSLSAIELKKMSCRIDGFKQENADLS